MARLSTLGAHGGAKSTRTNVLRRHRSQESTRRAVLYGYTPFLFRAFKRALFLCFLGLIPQVTEEFLACRWLWLGLDACTGGVCIQITVFE